MNGDQPEMFSPARRTSDGSTSGANTSPTKKLKRGSKTSYSELRDMFSEGVELETEDPWGFEGEDDPFNEKKAEFTKTFAEKMSEKLIEMELKLEEQRKRAEMTETEKLMTIARTQSVDAEEKERELSISVLAEQYTKTAILKALPEILSNLPLTSGAPLDETDVLLHLPESQDSDSNNDSTIITAQEFIDAMRSAIDEFENSRVFMGSGRKKRTSYAELVGVDDEVLLPIVGGFCKAPRVTVIRLVSEAEPMDFVIFKSDDSCNFELCINMPDSKGNAVTMRPITRTESRVWVEGMEVFERLEDLIGHLQRTGYTDVNENNETTSTKLAHALEIPEILVQLTHAVHGIPWPINIPHDEYFDGVTIDSKSHPEFYTTVTNNAYSLMQQQEHGTKLFAPITYCGKVKMKKSLRKLDPAGKLAVSREAIRVIKTSIKVKKRNLDASIISVMSFSDPEEMSLFARYIDDEEIEIFNRSVVMSVSTHGGIRVIDYTEEDQPEIVCDPFDSISMLTGGVDNLFSYFCYISRQPSGDRVCRVYKSTTLSAAIIDKLGDMALDRFLSMKEDLEQSAVLVGVARTAQVYVTTKISSKLPTRPLPMKYQSSPVYVDEDEEFEIEPIDQKILEKKLKEWLKDPSGPPPTSSNLDPFNRKNRVSAALEDRLEIIKFQVLRDWFQRNSDASDDILRELVEFADQLIEGELREYEEHVDVIKQEKTDASEEDEKKSAEVVARFENMITNSMPGQAISNDADVVNDSAFSDDDDDEFGFPYLELQSGSLAARLEEKTEGFGFRETALRGFIETKIRSTGGSLEMLEPPRVSGGDEPVEGSWGFIDPSQYVPPGFSSVKVFAPKGPGGFGLKLKIEGSNVFVAGMSSNSILQQALGSDSSRVVGARILNVNGSHVKTREQCVELLKQKAGGADITFLFKDVVAVKAPTMQQQNTAAEETALVFVSKSVFVTRSETGYGIGMEEVGGSVILRKAKPGSPFEISFGKKINGIIIIKINGEAISTKARAIELLKASSKGVQVDVKIPSKAKAKRQSTAPAFGPMNVFVTRSDTGYGVGMEEVDGKVILRKAKPGSPFENSLGKNVDGIIITKIDGEAVSTKARAIELLKASEKGVRLEVQIPIRGRPSTVSPGQLKLITMTRAQNGYGLTFSGRGGKMVVGKVKPSTPAAASNLQEGMELVSIAGLDTTTMSKNEIISLIQASKQTLEIGISSSSIPRGNPGEASPRMSPRVTKETEPKYATVGDVGDTNNNTMSQSPLVGNAIDGSKKKSNPNPTATNSERPFGSTIPEWLSNCSRPDAENLLQANGELGASIGRTSANASSGIVISMLMEDYKVKHFQMNKSASTPPKFFVPAGATAKNMEFATPDDLVQFFSLPDNKLGTHAMKMIAVPINFRPK